MRRVKMNNVYVIVGCYDSLIETDISVFADLDDARKEFDRIVQEYLDSGSELVFSSDYSDDYMIRSLNDPKSGNSDICITLRSVNVKGTKRI